uniref:Battenin n=1 Tax=Trichobilharzia regenti TaxID=157069 RepID=A0AA85J3E0_TRIRE|nr:unnamed protein product [Trichobilharzia regenti]
MYSRMREGQRFYCCSNRRKCRNNIAFWCFGLGNNFSYVIMLSAAVDIIRKQENPEIKSTSNVTENRINCTQIGTGSVLLADILPSMLFKFIAPMFIQRLHFHFKIICAVLLAVNSFLMVSFSQSFFVSLLGIVSASLSSGIGDVSFLSMLAFFDKSCVSAWSSGTGAAGLIGSLVYVGLTAIVTPETTLRIIIIVPCGILIVAKKMNSPSKRDSSLNTTCFFLPLKLCCRILNIIFIRKFFLELFRENQEKLHQNLCCSYSKI